MTAAVAHLPIPPMSDFSVCDPTAEARKRRREILSTQRNVIPDIIESVNPTTAKRRKVEEPMRPKKKPQMKYDPDIPMTKEEAAVWRREQRRKRNRESAAASRQRQRDRINELESEVQDWKTKYEEIMAKVRHLGETLGTCEEEMESEEDELQAAVTRPEMTRPETPEPVEVKTVTPRNSPTSTTCIVSITDKITVKSEDIVVVGGGEQRQEQPSKMISRQA